ncbi:MAG: hypothetical protein WC742_03015 [Gallionellaceae bacterium]|jgi:hypothetical protein
MAASLTRAGWLLMLAGLINPLSAAELELLGDPTRPAFEPIIPVDNNVAGDVANAPAIFDDNLQSIIISPQYRAAVIGGITVAVGEKIGDATLVEVRESSVVLSSAKGKKVLELFPGVRINKIALPVMQEEVSARINTGKKINKKKKKKTSGQNCQKQNVDERKSK